MLLLYVSDYCLNNEAAYTYFKLWINVLFIRLIKLIKCDIGIIRAMNFTNSYRTCCDVTVQVKSKIRVVRILKKSHYVLMYVSYHMLSQNSIYPIQNVSIYIYISRTEHGYILSYVIYYAFDKIFLICHFYIIIIWLLQPTSHPSDQILLF